MNYFQKPQTKDIFYCIVQCALCIVYCIVPGPDGGCRCWNTLMARSKVAWWTDAPRNLETIEDGGETEIFLVKKCQKGRMGCRQKMAKKIGWMEGTWSKEWSLSGWYLGGQRPRQWEASNSSGWKMKEKPSSFLKKVLVSPLACENSFVKNLMFTFIGLEQHLLVHSPSPPASLFSLEVNVNVPSTSWWVFWLE